MVRRISDFKAKIEPVVPNFDVLSVSIDELTAKTIEILRREVQNLLIESSGGKLAEKSSTALVAYIKLLGELKKKEKDLLEDLEDEFLEKIAKGQDDIK